MHEDMYSSLWSTIHLTELCKKFEKVSIAITRVLQKYVKQLITDY